MAAAVDIGDRLWLGNAILRKTYVPTTFAALLDRYRECRRYYEEVKREASSTWSSKLCLAPFNGMRQTHVADAKRMADALRDNLVEQLAWAMQVRVDSSIDRLLFMYDVECTTDGKQWLVYKGKLASGGTTIVPIQIGLGTFRTMLLDSDAEYRAMCYLALIDASQPLGLRLWHLAVRRYHALRQKRGQALRGAPREKRTYANTRHNAIHSIEWQRNAAPNDASCHFDVVLYRRVRLWSCDAT